MSSRSLAVIAAGAAALFVSPRGSRADGDPPSVARHVAAATAAAGERWQGLLNVLCPAPRSPAPPTPSAPPTANVAPATAPASPPSAAPAPAEPAPPAGRAAPPERAAWYAPPVQVFDNLYYVGMTEYSAWAVTTSEGIILIDTLYDYSVQAEVVDGLRQLGLDPARIRYAIVSHGHRDHSGGAKLLQDTFGTKIVSSAADWDLLDASAGPRPRRDVVATDGMALTLGDTTLRLYVTPGHTLGTISSVIPLRDHGRPHVAVTWGGTAFNWLKDRAGYITPERSDAFWFRHYITSAERFASIAASANADVLLSNHTVFDGSQQHLPSLRARRPEASPYVVGPQNVRTYLTVASECAKAGLARVPAR